MVMAALVEWGRPHRNPSHHTAPHRTASHRILSHPIASHRISSRPIPSHTISSPLLSSPLLSSPLISSHLISSHLVSSQARQLARPTPGPCMPSPKADTSLACSGHSMTQTSRPPNWPQVGPSSRVGGGAHSSGYFARRLLISSEPATQLNMAAELVVISGPIVFLLPPPFPLPLALAPPLPTDLVLGASMFSSPPASDWPAKRPRAAPSS